MWQRQATYQKQEPAAVLQGTATAAKSDDDDGHADPDEGVGQVLEQSIAGGLVSEELEEKRALVLHQKEEADGEQDDARRPEDSIEDQQQQLSTLGTAAEGHSFVDAAVRLRSQTRVAVLVTLVLVVTVCLHPAPASGVTAFPGKRSASLFPGKKAVVFICQRCTCTCTGLRALLLPKRAACLTSRHSVQGMISDHQRSQRSQRSQALSAATHVDRRRSWRSFLSALHPKWMNKKNRDLRCTHTGDECRG